jgi:hypothetical protein
VRELETSGTCTKVTMALIKLKGAEIGHTHSTHVISVKYNTPVILMTGDYYYYYYYYYRLFGRLYRVNKHIKF